MGASGSKIEEDKALQLCRERKKFVRQALDGRCSLAAAHFAYIETLKSTGTALRKFVELEAPAVSSLYTSTNATPEPLALTEKSLSQFSYSSPSFSQRVDATETFSPSPSPPTSSHFQANHMKFGAISSKKVEEKPPLPDIRLVTSLSTPQNTTPRSTEKPESSPFEASSFPSGTPQWDFFGLWHPIDHQLSFQEGKELNQGSETVDHLRQLREEEGLPELEDEEGVSLHEREETQASEDEFDDEPPTDSLVRSFENLNRVNDHNVGKASSMVPPAGSVASETDFLNGEKSNSPDLSPLGGTPSSVSILTEIKKTPVKEDDSENKVAAKDFPSVMKDIEFLFIKASESGKEVPRMLEANKLHFRPIFPGREGGLTISTFFRACFSCGEDPSQVKEDPPQTGVKYLTWHRTTSSRSSSSGNPLGLNSKDDVEDLSNNLFSNTCMISGSDASTLDRLYAWERKLYDEVKASELIRSEYDLKCKILRQMESRGESSSKIDKTRAVIKDLHSRIRVAIHRIHSISKRIEELRDNELQPQLEELIEGLSRMWEVMSECHRRQFEIISVANKIGNMKISVLSESHWQITAHLEDELRSLSSSFAKWFGAQKAYLKAINSWLEKCVPIGEKSLKRSKRKNDDPQVVLRILGPPIYVTCGVWYDNLDNLEPALKNVSDSIKCLAADTSGFIPQQEKEGKNASRPYSASGKDDNGDSAINISRDEAMKERMSASRKDDNISDSAYNMFRNDALKDSFGTSLVCFLGQLKSFAEESVKMYAELDKEIQDAKRRYDMLVQGAEIGNDESNVQSNDQSNNQSSSGNPSGDPSKDQLKS
ncbi:nitrate regulatory gene2 protein-like [Durio zibethinus]|uniref:Nitrate regulatory gene2 protein-like n=1 Tax=Durio zibethinus TaxID=66656 RepID=A0A6P5ZT82_DURZI|nr:nitrate regulatory gene2 protein-like [Durio zibethinus]XP_022755654.1 nitrate regulatory gene2 protein-like [Durio zibethinus]XP_022755655.1 nitrate regulatory gene2 protein-like [Durio zibethinus]